MPVLSAFGMGGSEVQGRPRVHGKFEANVGDVKCCQKGMKGGKGEKREAGVH